MKNPPTPVEKYFFAFNLLLAWLLGAASVNANVIPEVESNNDRSLADALVLDSNYRAGVSPAKVNPRTDLDFFRLTTPAFSGTATVTVTMTPTSSDNALDAKIQLQNSSGTVLKTQDTGYDDTPETLTYQVSGSTTYYIVCSSADLVSSGSGDYVADVSITKVTGLSFRNGTSSGASVINSIEAGQTVYFRADAIGMNGQTIQLELWEDDGIGDDQITPPSPVSITINSSGYGTYAWSSIWQRSDGDTPINSYYLYYRVTGVYSGSPDTGHFLFRDTTPPSTFDLSSPADGAMFTTSSVDFSWGSSSDPTYGSGFRDCTLQVDDNSDFSSPLINRTGLTTTTRTETISNNGTYYWRVIAYDNNGNARYSNSTRSFQRQTPRVTGLSFRNGTSSGASVISSIEAGQTVYFRADAIGMNGQTIQLELWEDDGIGDDQITPPSPVSITINSSGYGTAPWSSVWQRNDGDTPINSYYLYYRAGGVYSGSPDTGHFLVLDATPPSVFDLSTPADGAVFTTSSVDFSWGSSSDATYGSGFRDYTLQVDDNSNFSSPFINRTALTGTSRTETISADGIYYWRVIAYDDNGNARYSTSTRSFLRQTPRVTGLSFRDGSSSGASVISSIEAGQTVYLRVDAIGMNGQTIQLELWEDDGIGDDEITPPSSISITINSSGYGTAPWLSVWQRNDADTPINSYYLYYRAGGVYSGSPDTGHFLARDTTAPSIFDLSSPAEGAVFTTSSVNFSWSSSIDSTHGSGFRDYTLQVDDNSDFSSPLINRIGLLGTTRNETISNNGTYYWRVISYDNNGNARHSANNRSFQRATPNISPSAPSSGISGQPSVLKIGEVYSITTQYTDPDGAGNLRYCYLRVGHPTQPITLQYDTVTTAAGPLTIPEMALISPVSVERTNVANGIQLKWRFFFKHTWPLTGSGINFQVRAEDFAGASDGYNSDGRSLAFQNPAYGCTAIIHGWRPSQGIPEWVRTMGKRTAERLGNGKVYEYQPATGTWTLIYSVGNASDYEEVLLFDWADESDNLSTGYAEAAGDAFVASLIQRQKNSPSNHFLDRIHFIGHSRGCVVASEMMERLRALSVSGEDSRIFGGNLLDNQIDVTFLDPHTTGTALTGNFGDPDVNEPDLPSRGVVVWKNVGQANNYYQDTDESLWPGYLNGEFVLGSRNRNLDRPSLVGIDHSEVHAWYFGTIDPEATDDELAAMIQESREDMSGSTKALDSAQELGVIVQSIAIQRSNWYLDRKGIVEGFAHTRRGGESPHDDDKEPLDSTSKVEAFHKPVEKGLFNGSFAHGSEQVFDLPGWDRHGGEGYAPLISGTLRLLGEAPLTGKEFRQHNRLFIPTSAEKITFKWRIVNADSGTPPNVDRLIVALGNTIVSGGTGSEIWLNQTSAGFRNAEGSIPPALRGTIQTIRFEIVVGGLVLNSTVDIDDVMFASEETSPSVTINQAFGQSDPTGNSPINFSVVFSEPVTGFDSSDVTLVGTAIATTKTVTGSGTTYNVAVRGMTQSGTVIASIPAGAAQDGAGNSSLASTSSDNSVTYAPLDTTLPTVSISSPANAQTFSASPITVSGIASDPGSPSSGVASVKVRINSGTWQTASGTTIWNMSANLASGSNLIEAQSRDNAGNYSSIASVSVIYSPSDTTPPGVTINQAGAQSDPTSSSPINFTVVFSEPVTGFGSSDVALGGTAGATGKTVTGSGTTYTVAVSGMTQSGAVTAIIPAGAAQDGAGNSSLASTSSDNSVTYSAPSQYTITASAGTGGTISPSGNILKNAGESQLFTASSNVNYVVNQWLVDGSIVQYGGTTYTLVNIQADQDVLVTFRSVPVVGPVQAMVNAAASGDTIQLDTTTYFDNVTIDKDLQIIGAGPGLTIIDGASLARVFKINAGVKVVLKDLTIQNGRARLPSPMGGGIYSEGELCMTNCIVQNNYADTSGGGICAIQGVLSLDNVIVSENEGFVGGGVFANNTAVTLHSCLVSTNSASRVGGGLHIVDGSLMVRDSAISQNHSSNGGGGVSSSAETTVLVNTTISQNDGSMFSGGISAMNIRATNCTITGNIVERGGGGVHGGGEFINTIIAGNTSMDHPDFWGTLVSHGFNLIQDTNGLVLEGDVTGNLLGVDPKLGPLQNNGGFTPTHALLSGSPAIDAGSALAFPSVDQRGVARPQNGGAGCGNIRSDIGAYEADNAESIRICSVAILPTGHVRLILSGLPLRNYTIQSASSFGSTEWETVSSGFTDQAGLMESLDSRSPDLHSRFYRAVRGDGNMVWINPGTFTMGSPESEPGRYSYEGPQTLVTISQGFWMGRHEVTQRDYLEVMGNNPSHFTGDLNLPVEKVSWADAVAYCAALTERERTGGRLPAGHVYRLPTEAEWEYACRAGTTTPFPYGPAMRSGMANFDARQEYDATSGAIDGVVDNPTGVFLDRTTPAGTYAPNAWGLFDMHGNVWEWCQDWYTNSLPGGSVIDPQGPATGSLRSHRGAAFAYQGRHLRSAYREGGPPDQHVPHVGFRVVLAPEQTGPTPIPNMSWIPAGTFTMGSPASELERDASEGPLTQVAISHGFWLGRFEVTQGEYLDVIGSNPSQFTGDLNLPVERVSWADAVTYCQTLTQREAAAGRLPVGFAYRLPTDAEWEYACRAGTTTAFHYGPMLRSEMANFHGAYEYDSSVGGINNPNGTYRARTTTVGAYAPNAWGLYDMHGNVWEFCSDWWSSSLPGGSVSDPQGPMAGTHRIIRGGSWGNSGASCRSAIRNVRHPNLSDSDGGFRVVLAPEHTVPTPIPNMSWIPAGTFTMGSPESEPERDASESPATQVTISRSFWMGRFEVTQGEYLELMGSNPSHFSGDANRPVEKVTWDEAMAYCAALTTRERNSGGLSASYEYRLPTEAEWEYACRAGTISAFHYGTALRSAMADFNGQSEYDSAIGSIINPSGIKPSSTSSIGRFAPNAWGLYDMHGGVWEWCLDWSSASLPGGAVTDPPGAADGSHRAVRGGSWNTIGRGCRSAARNGTLPDARIHENGFRVVLAPVRP